MERILSESKTHITPDSSGQCKITRPLETPSSGKSSISTGHIFSVFAKQNIQILSFELAHFSSSTSELEIEIYTRDGDDYLNAANKPEEWTLVSRTFGADSPDEEDESMLIAPRAHMNSSVPIILEAGESKSFYLFFRSEDLHLKQSSRDGGRLITGEEYFSDEMLQTNVGIGTLPDFQGAKIMDRAFNGRIHYRYIQACNDYTTATEVVVLFALDPDFDLERVHQALKKGIRDMLESKATWVRWMQSDGLELLRLNPVLQEKRDDCTEKGFGDGCNIYNNTLVFRHYQSLTTRQVELEFLNDILEEDGVIITSDNVPLVYTGGEQVLKRSYTISLTGVPNDTLLNELQLKYIEDVTLDFFDKYSAVKLHAVEIVGQNKITRSLRDANLRGSRELQEEGIQVESLIYSIGNEEDAFFSSIERIFQSKQHQYQVKLQREQYRPGAINDEEDFGFIFAKLSNVSFVSNVKDHMDEEGIPVWVFVTGGFLLLVLLVIASRVFNRFFLIEKGSNRRKVGNSHKGEQQEKPRQGLGKKDFGRSGAKKIQNPAPYKPAQALRRKSSIQSSQQSKPTNSPVTGNSGTQNHKLRRNSLPCKLDNRAPTTRSTVRRNSVNHQRATGICKATLRRSSSAESSNMNDVKSPQRSQCFAGTRRPIGRRPSIRRDPLQSESSNSSPFRRTKSLDLSSTNTSPTKNSFQSESSKNDSSKRSNFGDRKRRESVNSTNSGHAYNTKAEVSSPNKERIFVRSKSVQIQTKKKPTSKESFSSSEAAKNEPLRGRKSDYSSDVTSRSIDSRTSKVEDTPKQAKILQYLGSPAPSSVGTAATEPGSLTSSVGQKKGNMTRKKWRINENDRPLNFPARKGISQVDSRECKVVLCLD